MAKMTFTALQSNCNGSETNTKYRVRGKVARLQALANALRELHTVSDYHIVWTKCSDAFTTSAKRTAVNSAQIAKLISKFCVELVEATNDIK